MEKLILDSDVVINWLTAEQETISGKPLWVAPATILELGERKAIQNELSFISLMEVRYALRRKKRWPQEEIESDLRRLQLIMTWIAPEAADVQQANSLQCEESLDPFDSLILAQAIGRDGQLITRDSAFAAIARKYVPVFTPEAYIDQCLLE
ncbi:MAG TPA: PIN domain-containing protein [Bacilli bacterium]